MKRTTKHVALDAHEATTVGLVREECGRVIARSVLPTRPANGLRGRLRAHTGLSDQWPCRHQHGWKVVSKARRSPGRPTKPPIGGGAG